MAKQVITRKDGITYERNVNTNNYNKQLYIRVTEDMLNKLAKLAKQKETTYSELSRSILEKYIESQVI